jgi:mannonate dehydratase
MFAMMKELVKNKYKNLVQPGFVAQYPGGGGYAGWAFNVAYTRALLQAALDS